MNWKTKFLAAPALALATLVTMPAAGVVGTANAACDPGERIDRTTAGWASEKAKAAGYTQIRIERKGCDNFWHGIGTKGGQQGRFVVSPEGEVMPEGD